MRCSFARISEGLRLFLKLLQTMALRQHLDNRLRWRTVERLEAVQSDAEVAYGVMALCHQINGLHSRLQENQPDRVPTSSLDIGIMGLFRLH
ncbi:hypothetical protein TNCV_4194081 [Trichonephila clavipes]|nr:hypothetical protein TNCV_4194081 [Trichonephila clavipes]